VAWTIISRSRRLYDLSSHEGRPWKRRAHLDGVGGMGSLDDRPGRWLDRPIECGDGGVRHRSLLAKVSRQSIAFARLSLAEPESRGSSFHACPMIWIDGLVKVNSCVTPGRGTGADRIEYPDAA
jgi:hypothetical protein